MNLLTKLSKYIDIERVMHSIKTAIACLFGYFLCKIIEISPQWVIITIIVVMCAQIYVGSVIQKAYFRFLGTMLGCLFAGAILIFAGPTNLALAAAIALSSLIFSYLATGQESLANMGTLGATTTAIILFSNTPTLTVAAERFFEISLGIFIAALVSQFVLPIHARTHLRRAQITTLQVLIDYYKTALMKDLSKTEMKNYLEQDEAIVKTLLKQRQLAKESVREPFGETFDPVNFAKTLYCEREFLRAITFMYIARTHIGQTDNFLTTSPYVKKFHDDIIQTLATIVKVLESERKVSHSVHIPAIKPLQNELQKNAPFLKEESLYIDGFFFSAEILTNSLTKLARLYHVPIYKAV
jgi:uncharacterized membrane protein YccC